MLAKSKISIQGSKSVADHSPHKRMKKLGRLLKLANLGEPYRRITFLIPLLKPLVAVLLPTIILINLSLADYHCEFRKVHSTAAVLIVINAQIVALFKNQSV